MAGLEQHTETLARQFTDQDRLETSQKHSHLNALKMGVWIVVELMKCFEEQAKGVHIVTAKVISLVEAVRSPRGSQSRSSPFCALS